MPGTWYSYGEASRWAFCCSRAGRGCLARRWVVEELVEKEPRIQDNDRSSPGTSDGRRESQWVLLEAYPHTCNLKQSVQLRQLVEQKAEDLKQVQRAKGRTGPTRTWIREEIFAEYPKLKEYATSTRVKGLLARYLKSV
eukprot:Hpha_TRINITY_DN16171_c3_g7::TRINITY_DN16171_c3_g7_i2::g.7650::m.7650